MKYALRTIATVVLAPIAAGLAVEAAKPLLPEALPPVLRWIAMFSEWSGFPWLAGGAVGFFAGVWLDRVASVFDGRNPRTMSGKLKALAPEVEAVGLNILSAQEESWRGHQAELGPILARAILAKSKLARSGVFFPPAPSQADERADLLFLGYQLRCIVPAMREGDVTAIEALLAQTVRDNGRLEWLAATAHADRFAVEKPVGWMAR